MENEKKKKQMALRWKSLNESFKIVKHTKIQTEIDKLQSNQNDKYLYIYFKDDHLNINRFIEMTIHGQ